MKPAPSNSDTTLPGKPSASIIITNYNYARYLGEAIESALGQTFGSSEVLVVDDGSKDDSRAVIAQYGDRIVPVLKENGGQNSAFNSGFKQARGELILFLDADDTLLPTAVERAMAAMRSGVAQVHWPLWEMDAEGKPNGNLRPKSPLPEGNLRDLILNAGPDSCLHPPTSGNAWSRSLLEQVFPLPELERELKFGSACADAYLSSLAPLAGEIMTIREPQGYYRVHGKNDYAGMALPAKFRRDFLQYNHRCDALAGFCRKHRIQPDPEKWKRNNFYYVWMRHLRAATRTLADTVPPGQPFILVDEDQWRACLEQTGLTSIPFLEKNGSYWGPPADDAEAIREVERLHASGAGLLAIAWPAFWWLNHFKALHQYLRRKYRCAIEDESIVIFDLAQTTPP